MRIVAITLLLSLPATAVRAGEGPSTPASRLEALDRAYDEATRAYEARFDPASGHVAQQIGRYQEWPGWAFAPRFVELARRAPGDPSAFEAVLRVVEFGDAVPAVDGQLLPHYRAALEQLAREHRNDDRLGMVSAVVSDHLAPPAETFLRAVLAEGPTRTVRARACLGLARYLAVKRSVAQNPLFARTTKTPFEAFLAARYDPSYLDDIRGADPEALFLEAEALFERVLAEYADVRALRPDGIAEDDTKSLADVARAGLFELRNLSLGAVAPEIEGEDLDGEPLKLSDFRGKVVVLVSWATWCNPCTALIPLERELVERLRGEPFVLLGINGDEDRGTARRMGREEGMTWRSWWDGGSNGPIAARWNLRSWPRIFVLDARGVIRARQVRDGELDRVVDALLAEMGREPVAKP